MAGSSPGHDVWPSSSCARLIRAISSQGSLDTRQERAKDCALMRTDRGRNDSTQHGRSVFHGRQVSCKDPGRRIAPQDQPSQAAERSRGCRRACCRHRRCSPAFRPIWAQNIKDITLVQVGGSYSAIIDIARQATKDLGFKIEMQTVASDALLNRIATQPNPSTSPTSSTWLPDYSVPRGMLQAIDLKKYQAIGTRSCRSSPRASTPTAARSRARASCPTRCSIVEKRGRQELRQGADRVGDRIPTVYNADTLGIRPDLIGRPIEQLEGAAQSRVQGQDRDRRRARRSASWTPPWPSNRAAISNTATRAT